MERSVNTTGNARAILKVVVASKGKWTRPDVMPLTGIQGGQ